MWKSLACRQTGVCRTNRGRKQSNPDLTYPSLAYTTLDLIGSNMSNKLGMQYLADTLIFNQIEHQIFSTHILSNFYISAPNFTNTNDNDYLRQRNERRRNGSYCWGTKVWSSETICLVNFCQMNILPYNKHLSHNGIAQ